ncbi:MAG: serine acetyltransferase, partial [Planctomycetaceae bacterium]
MTASVVSATVPDWERERVRRFYDPSRQLLRHLRSYQKRVGLPGIFPAIARARDVFWHRVWSIVSGAEIPLNSRISGGLLLPHPNGIVIHPDAVIGPNCLLFQQVTIGHGGPVEGVPRLGGHVDVGAGAKILGGITIGDHVRIGANAVVLCDVPPGASAVGVP